MLRELDEGDMPFGFHPDLIVPPPGIRRSKLGTFPGALCSSRHSLQGPPRWEKIAYIQNESNKAINTITTGYTVGERESFAQQKKGAEDIILDTYVDTVEASYVRQLADIRVANGDVILGALRRSRTILRLRPAYPRQRTGGRTGHPRHHWQTAGP